MNVEELELEKLHRLHRIRDYGGLLREYRLLVDTPEEDISSFLKTFAFNLLKEWLDDFDSVWKTLNFFEKDCAIDFLKDVKQGRAFPYLQTI